MFDIDAGKIIIIGIVALVVIGPKELPRVLRQVGQAVGKMRRMASEFQGQFMDAMREADVADMKKDLVSLTDTAKLNVQFDPINDIRRNISSAMEDPRLPSATAGLTDGGASDSAHAIGGNISLPQPDPVPDLSHDAFAVTPGGDAAAAVEPMTADSHLDLPVPPLPASGPGGFRPLPPLPRSGPRLGAAKPAGDKLSLPVGAQNDLANGRGVQVS